MIASTKSVFLISLAFFPNHLKGSWQCEPSGDTDLWLSAFWLRCGLQGQLLHDGSVSLKEAL